VSSAPPSAKAAPLDAGRGRLDPGRRPHRGGDVLGEEAALARHHFERRPSGHGVDHLDEGAQHGAVRQADARNQRHAPRHGEHREREARGAARVKRRAMRSDAIYHTMVIAAALTPEDGASTSTFAPAASVPAASASDMASARLVVLVFP